MSLNTAITKQALQPWMEYGTVLRTQRDGFIVGTQDGELACEQAVGCVVAPRAGDVVLLSLDAQGTAFILSVLSRDTRQGQTELDFTGDVTLRVREGNLNLTAEKNRAMRGGTSRSLC